MFETLALINKRRHSFTCDSVAVPNSLLDIIPIKFNSPHRAHARVVGTSVSIVLSMSETRCNQEVFTASVDLKESCSFLILVRRRINRFRSPGSSIGTSSVTNRVQVATCLLVSLPPKVRPSEVLPHCSRRLSVRNA